MCALACASVACRALIRGVADGRVARSRVGRRYEDLRARPHEELRRLLPFLGPSLLPRVRVCCVLLTRVVVVVVGRSQRWTPRRQSAL